MGGGLRAPSVVEDFGEHPSPCGYCRRSGAPSISHGMLAMGLSVYDYQDFLDRGWRRSGHWLYKPMVEKTCCPPYTIRLEAGRFKPGRDLRRCLNRLNRYLSGATLGPTMGGDQNMLGFHGKAGRGGGGRGGWHGS